ncbi:MAG: VWA-like domain-containing protein [Candidatus Nitrosocaldaceae archaeon]
MDINQIIKDISLLDPALYFLLMNCRIEKSNSKGLIVGKMKIIVGNDFDKLDEKKAVELLARAVIAVYLRHKERKDRLKKLYGDVEEIANDVSNVITKLYYELIKRGAETDILDESFEGLVLKSIEKALAGASAGSKGKEGNNEGDASGESIEGKSNKDEKDKGRGKGGYRLQREGEESNGEVINDGNADFDESNILELAKNIGKGKSWFEKLYEVGTAKRIDLRQVLTQRLRKGIERRIDWKRINRKYDDYAGKRRLAKSRLIIAIDSSGSISDDEYKQFIEIINGFNEEYKMILIEWNDGIERVVEDPQRSDWEVRQGDGGTDITEVAKWVQENAEDRDTLIVLSDGLIDGLESLNKVQCNKILITKNKECNEFDETIKLNVVRGE